MEDVTREDIIKEAVENAKQENEAARQKEQEETGEPEEVKAEEKAADAEPEEEEPAEEEPAEETEDSKEAEAKSEGEGKEKKGLFKKKEKADKNKELIEELQDKVKRQLAEFENFRNRTEKEKTQMYDMGARNVLEKILPVIDNFERGLATVPESEAQSAFAEGMNMIYKQLLTELEKLGVTPIEAVGKEFDPNLHNAVMQVESEEYESGFVATEMQKGYLYRDAVLRHSMVGVVP
ncbi:MAG: nucleotide exchange factor GrpE [Lachnospiraceae bacterium]|nr:nucleotide exchange factor GrpE [Lachnospiraceae bacterium]